MKRQLSFFLFLVISCSDIAEAFVDKVIYGIDNRSLISELDEIEFSFALSSSRAVLAQIPNWRISNFSKESFSVETKDLRNGLNFCERERFLNLPIVSSCTAFMVGPDLIATAGHCVKDKYECKKQTWVLDYDSEMDFVSPNGSAIFSKTKSYSCAELLSWSENTKLDYAIIRLDRKIEDRIALRLRRDGKTPDSETLMVIGHPLGMPKMMSANVLIRDNSQTYFFRTNADTFSGNSGSPVIGIFSGLVEGILVRGDEDFVMDLNLGCQRVARCGDKDCRGESVQRSTFLPFKYIPKI